MDDKLKNTSKQSKADFFKFIGFLIIITVIIVVTILAIPWVTSLKDESGRKAFQDFVYSKGPYGVLILIGAQIIQVVFAFIPGEPLEILSGLLYGTFGGYVVCTVGILIGTTIIYYMVKCLGLGFISRFTGEGKFQKFKFLNDAKKLEAIVFLLFFIPGTPKDFLTYFIPATKMKPLRFFVIVAVARIPSIISSTFAGASIGEGKWIQTIIIFVVIGIISLLGIIFNDKIVNKATEKRKMIKSRNKK